MCCCDARSQANRLIQEQVLSAFERGAADHTHLALAILLTHIGATGLACPGDGQYVYVFAGTLLLFSVSAHGHVEFSTEREGGGLLEVRMDPWDFFRAHRMALGHLELRAPMDIIAPPGWCYHKDPHDCARLHSKASRAEGIRALQSALQANGRRAELLAEVLPVAELPELVDAYAYTSGIDVLRDLLARIPRQLSIRSYLKRPRGE
jgi:hypothetical protein